MIIQSPDFIIILHLTVTAFPSAESEEGRNRCCSQFYRRAKIVKGQEWLCDSLQKRFLHTLSSRTIVAIDTRAHMRSTANDLILYMNIYNFFLSSHVIRCHYPLKNAINNLC